MWERKVEEKPWKSTKKEHLDNTYSALPKVRNSLNIMRNIGSKRHQYNKNQFCSDEQSREEKKFAHKVTNTFFILWLCSVVSVVVVAFNAFLCFVHCKNNSSTQLISFLCELFNVSVVQCSCLCCIFIIRPILNYILYFKWSKIEWSMIHHYVQCVLWMFMFVGFDADDGRSKSCILFEPITWSIEMNNIFELKLTMNMHLMNIRFLLLLFPPLGYLSIFQYFSLRAFAVFPILNFYLLPFWTNSWIRSYTFWSYWVDVNRVHADSATASRQAIFHCQGVSYNEYELLSYVHGLHSINFSFFGIWRHAIQHNWQFFFFGRGITQAVRIVFDSNKQFSHNFSYSSHVKFGKTALTCILWWCRKISMIMEIIIKKKFLLKNRFQFPLFLDHLDK